MKELSKLAGLVESTPRWFVTYRLRRDVLQAYLARMAKI